MADATTEQMLAKVPLFEGLSKKHLRQVASLATRLDEPAGKALTKEGQRGMEFIVILDGEVEIRRGDEVIATRGAGDFVGEIALVDDVPRTATVTTKTPATIEVIGRQEFSTLLADEPEIGAKIKETAAKRRAELGEGEHH
jgi:CRP-like cAMP-binding protein